VLHLTFLCSKILQIGGCGDLIRRVVTHLEVCINCLLISARK